MLATGMALGIFTPRIYLVGELDWGLRKNFSGEHRQAHRANVSVGFTF